MELSNLVEFDAVEAGLAALRDKYAGVQFDVTSTEGNKAAREARSTCVSIRTSADKAYQDWNKPMLDKQRAMRSRLAEIKDAVKEVEEPIDAQIKEHERIKAEEKAERERIEAEKQKAIQDRIDAIKNELIVCSGKNSDFVAGTIFELGGMEISLDDFGDRAGEAEIIRKQTIGKLQAMFDAAKAHEVEQEKLAAERAELERMREEQRAKEAELERQKREVEEAKLAAEKAEQKRLAEIEAKKQAEIKVKEQAERKKAEAKAAEDARRKQIEFEKNGPGDAEIVRTLACHYQVSVGDVMQWLAKFDYKEANEQLAAENV